MWWHWVLFAFLLVAAAAVMMTLALRRRPAAVPATPAATIAATLTPSPYTSDAAGWTDPKTGAIPNTPLVYLKGTSGAPGRSDARPGQITDIMLFRPGYFQLYPTDVYTDLSVKPGFIATLNGSSPVEVAGSFSHQPIAPPGTGFTSLTVRQT